MAILGSFLLILSQNPNPNATQRTALCDPAGPNSLTLVSHHALPSLTFSYTSLLSAPSNANLALGPAVPSSWSILSPEVIQLAHS